MPDYLKIFYEAYRSLVDRLIGFGIIAGAVIVMILLGIIALLRHC